MFIVFCIFYYQFLHSYNDTEDGNIKMHRTILTEDILEYPTHVSQQDTQLLRNEDVKYSNGIMLKSNGTAQISSKGNLLRNASIFNHSNETHDVDVDIFMINGSFSMELHVCRRVLHVTRKRRDANRQSLASDFSVEENLMARFNESRANDYY